MKVESEIGWLTIDEKWSSAGFLWESVYWLNRVRYWGVESERGLMYS